jgi:hypothetical protein
VFSQSGVYPSCRTGEYIAVVGHPFDDRAAGMGEQGRGAPSGKYEKAIELEGTRRHPLRKREQTPTDT